MKRLFVGLQAEAPWPEDLPVGRIIEEKDRHLTLKFLGNVEEERIDEIWQGVKPLPLIGFGGFFDKIFITEHVVGWHVRLPQSFYDYVQASDFLPHVTLARAQFEPQEWKESFSYLPVQFHRLHLYESLGNSKYQILKTLVTLPPFEELEHTADIAFRIYGRDLNELGRHAELALAFKDPRILPLTVAQPQDIRDIVNLLNKKIEVCDTEYGIPFKAVSLHGELQKQADVLSWEMIVDV